MVSPCCIFSTIAYLRSLIARLVQRVAAMVRPCSASKPSLSYLKASGVEIRLGDLNDGLERLKSILGGVSILISAVGVREIASQRDIIRAAHAVGVRRVVPSDFAVPGAEGVFDVRDQVRSTHS